MTDSTINAKPLHPAVHMYAEEFRAGQLSRREFLSRATIFGATAATAYALGGLDGAARAQETPQREIRQGGTMRIETFVDAMKDPRAYDTSEIANQSRGFLEYLVEYRRDGTFQPMLLAGWEVNEGATQYTLNVRQGVTWNNGDTFTAEDVAFNFRRWADGAAEANAMASQMSALMDSETNQVRDGAVEIVDDHTVRLNLSKPDIAVIAAAADYPAAIVHPSYDGENPFDSGLGTGPFRPVSIEPGVRAVVERNPDHEWWGSEVYGGPYLDRIEYIDYGTDPSAWVAAAEAGEVDMFYETLTDYIPVMDSLGWVKSDVVTANTVTVRPNQAAEVNGMQPYADRNMRRALLLGTDNAALLELGYSGYGTVAADHHMCPIHPEYADIGPSEYNPDEAMRLVEEAGMADFEHELISPDEDWLRRTCDAVAAQLRDMGLTVTRTVLPGSTYWNSWASYPFSATNWAMRPLGVQVYALAYRSGGNWNETAYSNARFDERLAQALSIADAEQRKEVAADLETMLREDGVTIQPFWRSLYRHYKENVVGAEMHPIYQIHVYNLGFAA